MIIFLHGKDTYRLQQNRKAVLDGYKAKHSSGMNVFFVDAEVPSVVAEASDALKTNSFFNEVQLIVIENFFHEPSTSEALLEVLKKYDLSTDKTRVVLAIHPDTSAQAKPKAVFEFLSGKPHVVKEYQPLEGAKLEQWVKHEAHVRGASFASGALRQLLAAVGDDTWRISTTLDLLANYCRGPITSAAVAQFVRTESETNIFNFLDMVSSGRAPQAIDLLYRELAGGRDPYYILSMLAYQYRTMLSVKDASIRAPNPTAVASAAGVHPFVAKKLLAAVSSRKLDDLKCEFQRLATLEVEAKQGQADLTDSLYTFILS